MNRQQWQYKRIFARRKWEEMPDGSEAIAAGTRFEFIDDEHSPIDDFSAHLDNLGEDGWELVAVVPLSNYVGDPEIQNGSTHELAGFTSHCTYYFKRPKME